MNILILTHFLGRGGSSSLCVQVRDVLSKNGHTTQILATQRTEDRITEDAIFLFDEPARSKKEGIRGLLLKIQELKPDLVYSISGIQEMEVLRFLTIPRIRHFSSLESHDYLDIRYLFEQAKPYFDGVTANTPDVTEKLQYWAPGSDFLKSTFPYALDASLWPIQSAPLPNKPGKKIQICFIGRLEPYQKRAHWLPEIIGLVNKSQLPVEWHIYGDGPLHAKLISEMEQRCLENLVHFHGWLPQAELVKSIASHDIFFLCSRWEGLPIAMVEAMLSGQACLVPQTCAGAEYALDSGGGWLYEASSAKACAAKLIDVISKPGLIDKEKAAATHAARNKFVGINPAQQIQGFIDMLSNVRHNGKTDLFDQCRPFLPLPPLKYVYSRLLALKHVIAERIFA